MKTRLAAVLARDLAGEPVKVARICAELGISRQTYYKYKKRFEAEGLAGLVERSRRPVSSPNQTPAWLEDEIVGLRKRLAEDGWDNGAVSIRYALARQGVEPLPAVATVHRVLCRRGLVEPAPAKKPRSAYKRFEYPRTNACWQLDALEIKLADGRPATVFHLIDDHSRKALAAHACFGETGHGAWACFTAAVTEHGLPAMMLTDNGSAFSGKHRGTQARFESNLAALGVHAVTSSPYHPQTCGKNERSHRTVRQWLAAQAPPKDLAELQTLLDAFNNLYNSIRPHQALGGQTPNQRWETAERHAPPSPGQAPAAMPGTMRITTGKVDRYGIIGVDGHTVQVGREWQHAP